MAKIGPKEAARRALRERKAGKPAKTVTPKRSKAPVAAVQRKKAKARVAPQKRPLRHKVVLSFPGDPDVVLKPVPAPKLGRPSTGFDRAAYQRVYCRLWLRHGPLPS